MGEKSPSIGGMTAQLEWISIAEEVRFARVMERVEAIRKTVTADEIAEMIRIVDG